jgi:hypothetical protein
MPRGVFGGVQPGSELVATNSRVSSEGQKLKAAGGCWASRLGPVWARIDSPWSFNGLLTDRIWLSLVYRLLFLNQLSLDLFLDGIHPSVTYSTRG